MEIRSRFVLGKPNHFHAIWKILSLFALLIRFGEFLYSALFRSRKDVTTDALFLIGNRKGLSQPLPCFRLHLGTIN